jgi:hypothetical protein
MKITSSEETIARLLYMQPGRSIHPDGVWVIRVSATRWRVAGGEPLALLAACDALLKKADYSPVIELRRT